MAWTLKPMGDRVVVKPKSREETTRSGLVLPDTATERPQQGEVLSVGPGRQLDNGQRWSWTASRADTVLFAKYSGCIASSSSRTWILASILSERDVCSAVIENGTPISSEV
jgi:chaperonin GroES